jgi:hypothetical protein
MELDFLEKNVLKAISLSSAFTIREIKLIFEECRSFDQTIRVLKYCAERGVSVNKAIENIKSI